MTTCIQCKNKAIFIAENGPLCKNHFLNYFKHKFYKTVRQHKLISDKDIIAVGYSGGKDSTTLLHLLNSYCKKRNIELFAILIDEGIKDYRDRLIKYAKKFCKEQKIKLHII